MSSPVHWGWGLAGGAIFGRVVWGDSWYEIGGGALLGTPWGQKALAGGTKHAARGAWWGITRLAGTTFVRNAAWRTASFGGSAAAAVAAPVAIGALASYAIAGKEGVSDYADFMTGKVSPSQWWDAVTLSSMR